MTRKRLTYQGVEIPPEALNPSIPFSLECEACDAGDNIDSFGDAVAAGWKDIRYDDGPCWNFLGMCPACQIEEQQDDNPPSRKPSGGHK